MADKASLPTNLDTKIPSMIVYNDINTIITIDGKANFSNEYNLKSWLIELLIIFLLILGKLLHSIITSNRCQPVFHKKDFYVIKKQPAICWLPSYYTFKTAYKKYHPFTYHLAWSCPRPISNSQLHVLPHFHLCPIYLVVFKGSYYFRRDISSWGGLHA